MSAVLSPAITARRRSSSRSHDHRRVSVRGAGEELGRRAALLHAGQIRRALAESDAVVDVAREVAGGRVSPYTLSTRASLLSYAGRHDEAIATAAEAIRNSSATAGTQVPFWTNCIAARVHAEAGDFEAADRALAELDRAFAAIPSAPAWLAGMRDIYRAAAIVERGAGSAAEAADLARRAFEVLAREKRSSRDLLQPLLIAARAAVGAGNLPAARAGFERAIENLRDAVGEGAPETRRAERLAAEAAEAAAPTTSGG